MIDLRGKKMYVGNQEIANAYLGKEMFFGQSLIVQPVDYTGSIIAINVQNEKMNVYVNTTPNSPRVLNTGATFASAGGLTPTISNNCIVLKNQVIVVKTGLGAVTHDLYAEITFKASTLRSKTYACFLANTYNSNYFKIESVLPEPTIPRFQTSINSKIFPARPIPETEYVTFSLSFNSSGSRVYVNGNLTDFVVNNTFTSEYVFFGAATNSAKVGTAFDRIDIVDIKWGNKSPSGAQIAANYQNIQQRLQTT